MMRSVRVGGDKHKLLVKPLQSGGGVVIGDERMRVTCPLRPAAGTQDVC